MAYKPFGDEKNFGRTHKESKIPAMFSPLCWEAWKKGYHDCH